MPELPDEPWRGSVNAIRLDIVEAFLDELDRPVDGWWEIDAITLR